MNRSCESGKRLKSMRWKNKQTANAFRFLKEILNPQVISSLSVYSSIFAGGIGLDLTRSYRGKVVGDELNSSGITGASGITGESTSTERLRQGWGLIGLLGVRFSPSSK